MKRFFVNTCLLILSACLLMACSGKGYLNVIPSESTALVSIDMAQLAEQSGKTPNANVLRQLFRVSDMSDCGIDLSKDIYLFVAPDGNLGLAAKVSDDDDLEAWLQKLAQGGLCQQPQKHKGKLFTVLKQSWVVGVSDDAMLVMGPVVVGQQAELMQQMTKYLEAEAGIEDTPMFARLQEIQSPVAMVAQAGALPEQLVAPFTLGAPKDTDPARIVIAADMNVKDGCLVVDAETFSFDDAIDRALKTGQQVFRPVAGEFVPLIPSGSLFSLLMNVDGRKYLPMMRDNKQLRALMTGVGVKIDIDKFIEGVDGDMVFVVPQYNDDHTSILWAARQRADAPELDAESHDELEKCRLASNSQLLPATVVGQLKGRRLCALVNLGTVDGEKKEAVEVFRTLLRPLFGDVNTVVWSMKARD